MHQPGIEPGPPGWKPGILTVRPHGSACVLWFDFCSYTTDSACLHLLGQQFCPWTSSVPIIAAVGVQRWWFFRLRPLNSWTVLSKGVVQWSLEWWYDTSDTCLSRVLEGNLDERGREADQRVPTVDVMNSLVCIVSHNHHRYTSSRSLARSRSCERVVTLRHFKSDWRERTVRQGSKRSQGRSWTAEEPPVDDA